MILNTTRMTMLNLWDVILEYEGKPFATKKRTALYLHN